MECYIKQSFSVIAIMPTVDKDQLGISNLTCYIFPRI